MVVPCNSDLSITVDSPKPQKQKKVNLRKGQRIKRKALKVLAGDTAKFGVTNPNAAGIDVGSEEMFVAVPPGRDPRPVRVFGAFTEDLHHLADWLILCNITTVVMESTGVYWIPLFQVLEARGLEVCLVNARHAKNLPGRKTDVVDCQWLQKLHTFGLLASSFRPPDEICVLRSYIRQRDTLIQDGACHIQHMQKALTEMNVLLHKAVTDITGTTGIAIVEAILAGERDPNVLASHRDPRCKKDKKTIAKALQGDFRSEHLFILKQSFDSWKHSQQQIAECDRQIEPLLENFECQTCETLAKQKKADTKKNQVTFDLRNYLYQISGVDITEIPSIGSLSALTIISEIGVDLSAWRTERHFSSWLGLCPDNRISGGKVLSVRTRKVPSRVANILRLAARSLHKSQSALGSFFRRMKYKIGFQAAITATAHKLARIVYVMLKYRRQYDPSILQEKNESNKITMLQNVTNLARKMGYQLIPVQNPEQAEVS